MQSLPYLPLMEDCIMLIYLTTALTLSILKCVHYIAQVYADKQGDDTVQYLSNILGREEAM